MATNFSMLGIMNAALVSVGYDEITSEYDGTPEFRVMSRNWPFIVEAELEVGLYSFTKQQATLNSRIDGKYGFADGYLVPGDAMHVRHLWKPGIETRSFSDWTQDGTAVYLDSVDGCVVEYVVAADPHLWGANFAQGVQFKLQAALQRGLMGEFGEAAQSDQMAQLSFEAARTVSSKSRAARPTMRPGGIAAARFGRYGTS